MILDVEIVVSSDDGARLWVNNRLVIDRWQPPFEPQTISAPVELKAGAKVDVRMEYYDAGGDALIQLLWSSASTPQQIIQQRYLYPEVVTNESAPADANKQTVQVRETIRHQNQSIKRGELCDHFKPSSGE